MFFMIIAVGSKVFSIIGFPYSSIALIFLISFSALITLLPIGIDLIRSRLFRGKMEDLIEPELRKKFYARCK